MNSVGTLLKAAFFTIATAVLAPFYLVILLVFYRWRRDIGPRLIRFYSRICLRIFRVKTIVENYHAFAARKEGVLIVANHASFLDIFVLSSVFGAVFISKKEVKYYPVIGWIARLSGVVFLDRSSVAKRARVLGAIAYGHWKRVLAVFPQGTTGSIGERLPFNRGIFKVTELNRDITLLPVTLRYRNDEEIAWSRPQTMKENAMKVAAQREIKVKVLVHAPVTIDDCRGKTTGQICEEVQSTVLEPLARPR